MIKLIKSDLQLLLKNKMFYLVASGVLILNVAAVVFFTHHSYGSITASYQPFVLASLLPFAMAVVAVFSVGKDKSIKNKLTAGYTKTQIYLSYLITSFSAAIIISLPSVIDGIRVVLIARVDVAVLLVYYVLVTLALCAVTSLLVMVTLYFKTKTASLLLCFVLCFAMLGSTVECYSKLSQPAKVPDYHISESYIIPTSEMLIYGWYDCDYEQDLMDNPLYIGGIKRIFYKTVYYASPYRIIFTASDYRMFYAECEEDDVMEYFNGLFVKYLGENSISAVTSLCFIFAATYIGIRLFKRKNIE